MAPSHGPQFDEFRADSGNPHNGAQADSGYGTRGAEPHGGLLFDEKFTAAAVNLAHGARYDDFGWQAMPFGHGARYDQGFAEPAMGDPAHGTWHDVFRGGAQVKLIVDGKDVQAAVIRTHDGHGEAVTSDGRSIEFMLSQVSGWRRANTAGAPHTGVKTAQAGDQGVVARPAASAPARGSQADANANGGRTALAADPGPAVANKTSDDDVDVAKRGSAYAISQGTGKMRVNVGPFCRSCGTTVKKALSGSTMSAHPHVGTCRSCNAKVGKTTDAEVDVTKDVDATETALQKSGADTVGHRQGCPRGGDGPCGADEGGRCAKCSYRVEDHQALGKTYDELLLVVKQIAAS